MASDEIERDVPQLSIIGDAKRVQAEAEQRHLKHPKGWEPGVAFDGEVGVISTGPRTVPSAPSDNDWLDLLTIWNLDPEVYEVDPDYNPEFRAWDANLGGGEVQRFYYYKAKIRLRHVRYGIDMDEMLDGIRRWKRSKTIPTGPHSLVVPISDWQIGKALADDTPVLTPSGWTTHGELRPGDYVFGPDGHPKMVTAVTGSTTQECYAVEFDGGVFLVASGEHRWAGWRRYKDSDGSYERRRLTWTTEQIAALVPTVRGERRHVERAFYVDLPAAIQASPTELPIDPYLLGVWLGDGNRHTGRFTTSVEDVDHWIDQFGALATVHEVTDEDNTVDVRIDGLTASLRVIGSLISKNIPLRYLVGSVDQRLSLLQGLMDTDGHAMEGGRVEFTNTNRGLADAVAWLATSLGMKVSWSEKRGTLNGVPKKWVYRVWFRPDASNDDHQVFRMKRKAVRLREAFSDQSRFRFVQGIEPVGRVSAQCITVEGGLYLAGRDLVVTHNSDGDGVRGTVERIMTSFDRIEDMIDDLKRSHVGLECLYLIGMGDLIEQCFAGDTEIITKSGICRLDKLAIHGHAIVKTTYGKWVDAEIRSFGVQELFRVELSRMGARKTIHTTAGHRWFRRGGNEAKAECITTDLQVGDYLVPTFGSGPKAMSPFGVARGYVFGDGHRANKHDRAAGCAVHVCRRDWDSVLSYFDGCRKSDVRHHNPGATGADVNITENSDFIKISDCPSYFKDLPSLEESPAYLMGWLAGYFAADGCVSKTVSISSARRDHLEFVADLCARVGIGTQPIVSQERTGIRGEVGILHSITLIRATVPEWFFVQERHRGKFAELAITKEGYAGQRIRGTHWRVESVEATHTHDEVFCAVVPGTEAFVLANDILTGNCSGNYPAQPFTTELNRREQLRLTFRCLRDGAVRLSKRMDRMVIGGVGGNHGENRTNGKMYTTPGDNDDLLVIEMVANALRENDEAFGHISFVIPQERLWIVLDISGIPVGFTHGHLAGRGATPQAKQKEWLKDMAFGDHLIGQARIVVTGHYHHLSVIDHGPKVHIQCPAMDGGSTWWINTTGSDSSPGTACFVVSSEYRVGFDHLRVV